MNPWLGSASWFVRPREQRFRQKLRHLSDRTTKHRSVDVYSTELTERRENCY